MLSVVKSNQSDECNQSQQNYLKIKGMESRMANTYKQVIIVIGFGFTLK